MIMSFGGKKQSECIQDIMDIISDHSMISAQTTASLIYETKSGNFPYYDYTALYSLIAGYVVTHFSQMKFSSNQAKLNDTAKALHYGILSGDPNKINYLSSAYDQASLIVSSTIDENSDGRLSSEVAYLCVAAADYMCLRYTDESLLMSNKRNEYSIAVTPVVNEFIKNLMNYLNNTKLK